MSIFRRSPRQPAEATATVVADPLPQPVTLYSEYVRRRPARDRPIDHPSQAMRSYMYTDPLKESVRHKLVLLMENSQPDVTLPHPRFSLVGNEMADIAIETIVAARGDLSLRPTRPHPQLATRPFEHLASFIIDGDASLALDAIGAWADTYARLPGLPWLRENETALLTDLERILSETTFAVRGREVILREDLGAAVLIDRPLDALVTDKPALKHIDAKLREALDQIAGGHPADAVTDAGTALQMLLEHLGHSGGQLGDQLKAARKAGWLNGIDTPMADALDGVVRWVASVRNQRSDAHHGPAPDRRDAEFVVRMVGLLVLRFG